MPGERPANLRQEIDQSHPYCPQEGEGQAEHPHGDADHDSCDHGGEQVAEDVADDGLPHLGAHTLVPCRGARGQSREQPGADSRPFEEKEHDQREDRQHLADQQGGALAHGEGRFGQIRAQLVQLRRVLVDPPLQVVVLNERPDRAAPVFGVGDVRGQPVSEVRHCVGQRISERCNESKEGNRRDDYDDGYRESPSAQASLK